MFGFADNCAFRWKPKPFKRHVYCTSRCGFQLGEKPVHLIEEKNAKICVRRINYLNAHRMVSDIDER